MEFKGKYIVPAQVDAVWMALHEPEMLTAALPGCESVAKLSDTDFKARATLKIGPVKARFEGDIRVKELPPLQGIAHAMILTGDGQAGPAGFVRGESQVRLSAGGAGTLIEYDGEATVGGRLAQVGQRAIDAAAKAFADEFFAKFAILMQAQTAAQTVPSPRAQSPPHPATDEEELAPQIWVAGLIGIVIILLIVFSIVL